MDVTPVTRPGPTPAKERMRRSRARRRERDAALARTLLQDASGTTPADALRGACLDALASGRPGGVDPLVNVATVLLQSERIDRERRRNLIESARYVSVDVFDRWHSALVEFGARITALGDTLPGMLTGADEAEIARVLRRELRAALADLQAVVNRIETGPADRATAPRSLAA